MLADLRELVEVESPSLDVDAVSASAKALAAIIERRLGGTATLVDSPAGPHVHWVGGGEPQVLLLGHHDTVFPLGTLADAAVRGRRRAGHRARRVRHEGRHRAGASTPWPRSTTGPGSRC